MDGNLFEGIRQLWLNLSGNRPYSHHPKKKVYDTNLRMIRVGCIFRKNFGGTYKYLLGRLEKHDEPDGSQLKTSGGYLHLAAGYYDVLDRSFLEGIIRETHEEGFTGKHSLLPDTVVPASVHLSEDKGMLQFYTARLKSYPMKGLQSEAVFRRRKDHTIYIRWCSVDELVDSMQDPSAGFSVQPETVDAITSAHFFDVSRKLNFHKGLSGELAYGDGDLAIPKKMKKGILDKAGVRGPHYDGMMNDCKVYYATPRSSALLALIPYVKIFFQTDLFLHEARLDISELKRWRRSASFKDEGSLSDWAADAAANYALENYDKIMRKKLVKDYVA